jgi:vitamin B12/bleomycin/antimicrobial peptide transport system ATP-binding/permease protein
LITLLIATVLLQLLTQYGLNFWNRDFFNAISRKDAADLWIQALRFVPLATASLFLTILSVWGRMTMQRTWRAWLSSPLYDYWLENDRYVRLRFMAGDHQTPEYRIAEDARVATDLPIDLALGLFSSFLTAITFIGILWSVGTV